MIIYGNGLPGFKPFMVMPYKVFQVDVTCSLFPLHFSVDDDDDDDDDDFLFSLLFLQRGQRRSQTITLL